MATKTSKVGRLLSKHKTTLIKDVDINRIVSRLTNRNALNKKEEEVIFECSDPKQKADLFVDILSEKGSRTFHEFCNVLEECAPHLLTRFLLDNGAESDTEKKPTQALQLGFELALKERDAVLRENARALEERDQAVRRAQQLQSERDKALASLENLSSKKNTPQIERRAASPSRRNKEKLKAMDSDLETENEESSDNVVWETHKVALTRVVGFGFGIAVSGGRDNPHFANGDPSIAISDVLKAGPAEGKLQINDRVLSVNGHSLENVDHSTAIGLLKDSGSTVNLVIRRRIVLPSSLENETPPLKVTLTKRNRKDDYGVILGCRVYIKEIVPNSLAAQEGGLKEGDTILKLNNSPIESLSIIEARKLLEKSKDKLQLIITKKREDKRKDDEHDHYKAQFNPQDIPPGAYPPNSPYSRFDGRYIYDHEAVPPRPPLPSGMENSGPPSPMKDGYYSDREDLRRQKSHGNYAAHDDIDLGLMRRHHEERYVGKRKDIRPDPRACTFRKDPDLGLGLRLAGGNSTGIFIASVQPGSGAESQGLTEGDHILKANDKDIMGSTREEAVTYLTSLEGMVTLAVQYKKEDFDRIMSSHEAGDSFYIRTHFNHEQQEPGELSFVQGDIFHIKDTLFRGVVGSWLAVRMGRNNQETQKGIIPNKNRAEQLAISSQGTSEDDKDSPSKGRSILFKRKAARRSKSLSKDHWEDIIFSHLQTKFPAYERVILRDPGFVRPVVIFGPLADVARERILKDHPEKFQSPQSEHHMDDERKGRSGIIRLGAIKEVMARRKHCLLDVTPHNVDRLNFAQFYPIVVFLKSDCKTTVKELRGKWAKGSSKNPKKLYEQSIKLDKYYQHLFTATVTHNTSEVWYNKLLDMVDLQQQQQIWMSEKKPEEDLTDDYLFPMTGTRYSFSGTTGRESDTDITRTLDDMATGSPSSMGFRKQRPLVRSSSDPSVNTTDRIPGIPPYPEPPRYHRSPKPSYDGNQNYTDVIYDDSYTQPSEDRYYPSYYADNYEVEQRRNRANIDPYATITPSERLRGRMPSDSQWSDGYDDQPRPPQAHQPDVLYSRPIPRQQQQQPPQSPGGNRLSAHEPGASPGYNTSQNNSSNAQNLPPPPNAHGPYNDNSSYSSDSFSKYTSNPANKHDDSKLREKMGQISKGRGNDPYRFTRSTANKVSATNVDKTKLNDLQAKFRSDERFKISSNSSLTSSKSPNSSTNSGKPGSTDLNAGGAMPGMHSSNLEPSGLRQQGRKQPPPVPIKTYNLKERGIEPDEQKIKNYDLRGYEYPEGNQYSALPQRKENSSRYRSHPNEQPGSPSETYKSEDPYEWVAPRRSQPGNQRSMNRNSEDFQNGHHRPKNRNTSAGEYRTESSGNQNGRSFMNQIYMDTTELNRLRQEREQQRSYDTPDRSRTDDELQEQKLRHINKSFSKSTTDVHSEKSNDSLLSVPHRENFSSYKNLITPGKYKFSKSHDELRDGREVNHTRGGSGSSNDPRTGSQPSSAFDIYSKSSPGQQPGTSGQSGNREPPKSPGRPDMNSLPRPENEAVLHTVEENPENASNPDENEDVTDYVTSVDQSEQSKMPPDLSDQSNAELIKSGDPDSQSEAGSISTSDTVVYKAGFDPTQDIDETHTVVATARGVFNGKGGVLESPETGVSIVIPPGALPDDLDQEIYFKVCRDNTILPPLDREKGETLLSPLVMCGPHGLKFKHSVELRLPHCASVNPDSWSFALKSSDSPAGHPTQWQNMTLAEREGHTQSRVGKNSVSVLVDHF